MFLMLSYPGRACSRTEQAEKISEPVGSPSSARVEWSADDKIAEVFARNEKIVYACFLQDNSGNGKLALSYQELVKGMVNPEVCNRGDIQKVVLVNLVSFGGVNRDTVGQIIKDCTLWAFSLQVMEHTQGLVHFLQAQIYPGGM